MAEALARRHGLRLYSADTRTWDHVDRLRAAGSAAARAWHEQPPEERYAHGDLLALSLHEERGPLVLEDLRALPTAPLIVAEGSVLPAVAAHFAGALAGACPGDRGALAQEAAAARAAQLAGHGARPWAGRVENPPRRSTQG